MKTIEVDTITLKAPAKVNLCLSVKYPPAQDGYHQLDSVFCELALHDVLYVAVAPVDDCIDRCGAACTALGTTVALECGKVDIATQDNLVFKAVDMLEQELGSALVSFDEALHITVDKNIPAGGGLGGGSSDAASMLKAACRLAGVDCLDCRVVSVAQRLGADVAFFLYGGVALMDGRGDSFVRALPEFPLPIVLMGDRTPMLTPSIYRLFDASPQPAPDALALASTLDAFPAWGASRGDKLELARMCANNLEPAVVGQSERLRMRIEAAKNDPDVLNAMVSGSGATSFAICADEGAAMRFEQRAAAYCDWTCIC